MAFSSMKLIIFHLVVSLFVIAAGVDFLTQSQSVRDGPNRNTLVSKNGTFELGFFSPGVSKNRYLGIWYPNVSVHTYVWVANRNNPINDSSGILVMNSSGNIMLLSHNTTVVWSARLLMKAPSPLNPKLQLLDTGNLVLRDEMDANSENYLWQSFDYPTDSFLPGMKLGWDLKNRIDRSLSAWKNPNDPSPGNLTWKMELHEYPETAMWKGSQEYFRLGPWNGQRVSGKPPAAVPILKFNFVFNKEEVYYQYLVPNKSLTVMMVLNQSNYMREIYLLSPEKTNWRLIASLPRDYCDNYALCGAYGYCDIRSTPACNCLKGFSPRSPESWKSMVFSDGCIRNKPMNCQDKVGFQQFTQLKLPDTTHTWVNTTMNLQECRARCLSNCSCMAYSNTNISDGGSGCVNWFGDLIDLKFVPDGGQDLYIRMLASELAIYREAAKSNHKVRIGVVVGAAIAIASSLAILLILLYIYKKRPNVKGNYDEGDQTEDLELPLFDLSVINSATDHFSLNNKLGEGGFGPVYWGKLENGQEIAVKRLSKSSGQGVDEFKNEVTLIAKLQHRNLVKLLGCCIQGVEKMLIYEYLPNKSLDSFIFDETRRKLLDWSKRFHIINGIAKGLVYLHQDSTLRIIHRDLKASNVLLDINMNPKISDFGIAKTFGGDQTEGNTRRVVGTYGYMAPEYAIDGQFSVKSDAFSFGILLLEIISGKKNKGSYLPNHDLNLIGYAWKLWKEGNPAELIDNAIGVTYNLSEVLRCIHIGLLCVQQYPDDRPTMSSVVLMLGSESCLPQPKQPGFFMEKEDKIYDIDHHLNMNQSSSTNELTITLPDPR